MKQRGSSVRQSRSSRHCTQARRGTSQCGRSPLVQSASTLQASRHSPETASQILSLSQSVSDAHSTQRPVAVLQNGRPPLVQSARLWHPPASAVVPVVPPVPPNPAVPPAPASGQGLGDCGSGSQAGASGTAPPPGGSSRLISPSSQAASTAAQNHGVSRRRGRMLVHSTALRARAGGTCRPNTLRSSNPCSSYRRLGSGRTRYRRSLPGRSRCNNPRWSCTFRRSACNPAAAAGTCPRRSRSCSTRHFEYTRSRWARRSCDTRACRRPGCTRRGNSRRWSCKRRPAGGTSSARSRSDRWSRCRPRSSRVRCRSCSPRRWDGSSGWARRSRIRRGLDRRCSSSTRHWRCKIPLRRCTGRCRICRRSNRANSSRATFRSWLRPDGRNRCSGVRVGRSRARSARCSIRMRPRSCCSLRHRPRLRCIRRRRTSSNSTGRGECRRFRPERSRPSIRPSQRRLPCWCPRCPRRPRLRTRLRCPLDLRRRSHRRRSRRIVRPGRRPSPSRSSSTERWCRKWSRRAPARAGRVRVDDCFERKPWGASTRQSPHLQKAGSSLSLPARARFGYDSEAVSLEVGEGYSARTCRSRRSSSSFLPMPPRARRWS
jgi:hypothetical protein